MIYPDKARNEKRAPARSGGADCGDITKKRSRPGLRRLFVGPLPAFAGLLLGLLLSGCTNPNQENPAPPLVYPTRAGSQVKVLFDSHITLTFLDEDAGRWLTEINGEPVIQGTPGAVNLPPMVWNDTLKRWEGSEVWIDADPGDPGEWRDMLLGPDETPAEEDLLWSETIGEGPSKRDVLQGDPSFRPGTFALLRPSISHKTKWVEKTWVEELWFEVEEGEGESLTTVLKPVSIRELREAHSEWTGGMYNSRPVARLDIPGGVDPIPGDEGHTWQIEESVGKLNADSGGAWIGGLYNASPERRLDDISGGVEPVSGDDGQTWQIQVLADTWQIQALKKTWQKLKTVWQLWDQDETKTRPEVQELFEKPLMIKFVVDDTESYFDFVIRDNRNGTLSVVFANEYHSGRWKAYHAERMVYLYMGVFRPGETIPAELGDEYLLDPEKPLPTVLYNTGEEITVVAQCKTQ